MRTRARWVLLSFVLVSRPASLALAQDGPGDGDVSAPDQPEAGGTDAAGEAPTDTLDPEARRRAELHLASARENVRAGHAERAIGDFTSAYEITHDPAILLEVASVQEELLQLPQALSAYEAFLATDSTDAALRARAESRAALLRQRIHAIQGNPRRPPREHEGTGDEEPDEPARELYDPTGRIVAHAILFGLSGAALVTAFVFGGLTLAEDGSLSSGCGATLSCHDADLEDLHTYRLTTDIAFFASLITFLGGVLFVLTAPDHDEDEPAAAETEASVSVAPWLDPRGGGGAAAVITF